jgi:putative endopeptidase
MKKLLAIALFAAACGSKSTPAPTHPDPNPTTTTTTTTTEPTTPVSKPAATPPAKRADGPEIGAWGFDLKGMNTSVSPGQSFMEYANGTWLKTTQIPPDKSNYGMFIALDDRSQERTKQIIQTASGPAGSEAQKIADYYKSFMDEAAIEAKGAEPIKPELEKIAAIKDAKGLVTRFAEHLRTGRKAPFGVYVDQDDKAPDKYLTMLVQSGLGLPDRDMYDEKKAQFAPIREGYKKYVAAMFGLIGMQDGEKRAAAVYALEEKIAAVSWSRTQNRDPEKRYNKRKMAQLATLAPGVDWKTFFETVGIKEAQLNFVQPSAIAGIAKLVKSEPVDLWKDYLTLHLLTASAPYLSKAFVDTRFEMYGKVLSGTPQNKERWKRGVDEVTAAMGEAVGKIYVEKHFTPETKAKADELVKNLLAAMGQRLDALPWMGAKTKQKAKAKLATYNPKIGYPTKWRDYSGLEVVAGDVLGNDVRASQFEFQRMIDKLGKPVDRDEWGMTPMTVNAYYNANLNEIVFPAAILQPPFFDPFADPAVNYGGIGAVIGHEISHGFDDQGAKFDAKGALANWWTKQDRTKFDAAKKALIAQYNAYCPIPAKDGKPQQCVKGEMTLGENIADLAGLTVAYQAYKLSLGGKEAPVIDGLTGDQRFFLGWAQVWRRLYRDQEYANRLVTDVHSPSEFRVAVVRNLDAFYEAFKPSEKDALFLAPDKRVRMW